MDIVRRNMFYIVCGLVTAGAVGLGVTGLQGMPNVVSEMKNVETLYRNLEAVKPINRSRLDAEHERIDRLVRDRQRVFEKAESLYGYAPLVADVFPAGDSDARSKFRKAYLAAMEKLMASLNYGGPASAREVAMWRDRIEDEAAQQLEQGLDAGVEQPTATPTGPPRTPAGVLTRAGARANAQARAEMARAQQIYTYATHFHDRIPPSKVSSLEFSTEMEDTGVLEVPELEPIWFAQLGYWIQKDVVDAIVTVNKTVAAELRKNGTPAWVGTLPVKEVISIRVTSGYIPADGDPVPGALPEGAAEAFPPGTPETVFTHSGSSDWYEVVQFTAKLIMDQREIPRLVDALSKNRLHTLLRVSYATVKPNRSMIGKIYGSGPVVRVVLDFETILLGDLFRPLMPDAVCEEFAIQCPDRPAEAGD